MKRKSKKILSPGNTIVADKGNEECQARQLIIPQTRKSKPTLTSDGDVTLEYLKSQVADASRVLDFVHVGTNTDNNTADADTNTDELWPEAEEVLKKWQQRAEKADQLITQLKQVVLAQHKKIEELQQRIEDDARVLPMPSYSVQLAMHSDMVEDSKNVAETNATLTEAVKGLKFRLTQAKKENNTLNKALKRYKNMVQDPDDELETRIKFRFGPGDLTRRSDTEGLDLSCIPQRRTTGLRDEDNFHLQSPSSKYKRSVYASRSKASMSDRSSLALGSRSQKSSKLQDAASKIGTKVPMLCSNVYQTDPTLILDRLYSSLHTIIDSKAVISLFILDVSLWRAVSPRDNLEARKFYFSGQVVLHEYTPTDARTPTSAQRRPVFTLENMRIRKKDVFVQPLEKEGGTWAIIQVNMETTTEEDAIGQLLSPGSPPARPEAKMRGSANAQRKTVSKSKLDVDVFPPTPTASGGTASEGLPDLVVAALVTVLQTAEWALGRWENACIDAEKVSRSCSVVSLAAELFRATNWLDFEVRMKHGIHSVFDATVRILIVDGKELVLSTALTARKKSAPDAPVLPKLERRCGLGRGVVGRCAQRRKIIRLNHLVKDTDIDAQADGLELFPMDSTALFGPLESIGRPTLGVFAVVQAVRSGKKQFSKNDEHMFSSIMVMAGEAGCRVVPI